MSKKRILTEAEIKALPLNTAVRIKVTDGDFGGTIVEEHGWRMVQVPMLKGAMLIPAFSGQVYITESEVN